MEEERRKVYVEVDVTHKTDGTARPRKIKFEDGEVYEIDRVRHCCRAASTKVGGTGLRYTVMICGTETFLFDEENGKWFVEGKKRAVASSTWPARSRRRNPSHAWNPDCRDTVPSANQV